MRTALAAVLALSLGFSVAAAVTSGPERPISDATPSASTGDVVDIATDGKNVLTLWFDRTAGREGIYATVVDDRGLPVRGDSERISTGWSSARAVWTSDRYLVVASSGGGTLSLLLDGEGRRIGGPFVLDIAGWPAALAWNGSRALMVVGTASGMRGVMLGASGEVLLSGIALPSTVTQLVPHTLTAAGSSFVFAWADEIAPQVPGRGPLTNVYAMRIEANGATGATTPLLLERRGFAFLASASSGSRAGVAISVGFDDKWQISPFTFDATTPTPQSHAPVDVVTWSPKIEVIPTPVGFAATYVLMDRSTTLLGVVDFDATAARTLILGTLGQVVHRAVANPYTAMIVVAGAPLVAVPLDTRLSARTRDAVAAAIVPAARQSSPIITPGAGGALIAWAEPLQYSQGRIVVRRFDSDGKPLDAAPIVVAEKATPRIAPAVAFTGKLWLIAWQENEGNASHVFFRRLSPDGTLLDAAPIDLGVGFEPLAASNGNVTVLITATFRNIEMTVVRFTPDGVRIDETMLSNPAADRSYYRSVVTNGAEFFIAWTSSGHNNVLGRRLDASGAPIETVPIAIATGTDVESHPAVASDGDDFVVVYAQQKPIPRVDPPMENPEPVVVRVRSKRVLRTGILADHTATQDGHLIARGTNPRIAWNGRRYMVTFVADEFAIPYEGPQPLTMSAASLDARGAASGESRTIVHGEWVSQVHSLALVESVVWSAYPRVAPELGNVERVFRRELLEESSGRRRTSRK
ncbi:MAG TPA: hypothetical protein VNI54_18910 [Thermoanaerobaculia bacterium]|nr:hypothetical protein [Thermoanaerobaculia bacterium]